MTLTIYLLTINLLALIIYAVDKRKAQKGYWRISEGFLLLLAAIGGSIGALAAMFLFRHKTSKWKFRLGIPVMIAVQVAVVIWLAPHLTIDANSFTMVL
jgi:uncharacterized membrane protein YsdA (DUF1294 family)